MLNFIISGFLTAFAVFVIACYFNIKVVAGYHAWFDIALSVGLAIIFFGTFSGMMTAAVAGLSLSVMLMSVRLFWGYRKYHFGRQDRGWREYQPRFNIKGMFMV